MFSFSGWEIMIVAAMAVLVISPKDLPRAMRTVGKYVGQARRMARGFQNQINDALREAELDDVRKEVSELGKIDPLADVRKDMAKAGQDLKKDLKGPDKPVAKPVTKPVTKADDKPATTAASEPPTPEAPTAAKAPTKPDSAADGPKPDSTTAEVRS